MTPNRETHAAPRLAELTTLRLGGPAPSVTTADSAAEVAELIGAADRDGGVLVLGGGSNLVVADVGVTVPVVRIGVRGLRVDRVGRGRSDEYDAALTDADPDIEAVATIGAGENWDEVVAELVADGWAGLETLSGIPGLAGAAPVQNIGAYGGEIAESLIDVDLYDRRSGRLSRVAARDLQLGYRTSILKGTDAGVITSLRLGLRRRPRSVRYAQLASVLGVEVGAVAPTTDVRAAVVGLRRSKGMVLDADDADTCSAGSFFTNPIVDRAWLERGAAGAGGVSGGRGLADVPRHPVGSPDPVDDAVTPRRVKLPAAWLIEHAGFAKGYPLVGSEAGPARPNAGIAISSKHTLALTNRGSGTTAELVSLAREIRDRVRDVFGVALRPEPVMINTSVDRQ